VEGESVNRSQRRWHLRLVAGLTPVAALTLAASVAIRRTVPVNSARLTPAGPAPAGLRELDHRLVRVPGLTLELRRLADSGAGVLEIVPLTAPHVADPLVYWGAEAAESLPADARLLGAIDGDEPVRFALPGDTAGGSGAVYLYSGATHRVLAHIAFPPRETPAP
jgi:hypothetical protein